MEERTKLNVKLVIKNRGENGGVVGVVTREGKEKRRQIDDPWNINVLCVSLRGSLFAKREERKAAPSRRRI